jgi:protein-L-isoaspartate(D-aspartate) O-methyltransferase
MAPAMTMYEQQRRWMVASQIEARGVRDERILRAMLEIPRERFVPNDLRMKAYNDGPLPIGWDQTISQPYVVALMIDCLQLRADDIVLEVGAGSGYAAAVMSRIAKAVYSLERVAALAERSSNLLDELGCDNVSVRHGDGMDGWAEQAPYAAISIAAGGRGVPEPLLEQLASGGRLVMPVRRGVFGQRLVRIWREASDRFVEERLGRVHFVPLLRGTQ